MCAARVDDYSQAIVLHEDKKYYPDASEVRATVAAAISSWCRRVTPPRRNACYQVYPDAEVLVQDEDAQPIEEPIIAPIRTKVFSVLEKEIPATTVRRTSRLCCRFAPSTGPCSSPPLAPQYTTEFLTGLMSHPELIRQVAVVGHLHHGAAREQRCAPVPPP